MESGMNRKHHILVFVVSNYIHEHSLPDISNTLTFAYLSKFSVKLNIEFFINTIH